jgi:hypothetical protein
MIQRRSLCLVAPAISLTLAVGCGSASLESLFGPQKDQSLPDSRNDACHGGNDDCGIPDTVPDFTLATFSNPTQIDNAYYPLIVGQTLTYESQASGETDVVETLNETRSILGVMCRVVRDRVSVGGVLIEDTHDCYAQDDEGNVWYMGEQVDEYNYKNNGEFIGITHDGAWEAGQDIAGLGTTALPGFLMKASPMVGDVYHQEYYEGEAEDMAEVVALNVPVTLSNGSSYSCLQTLDSSELEPRASEFKYYALGIGVVLEETVRKGDRSELVSISP